MYNLTQSKKIAIAAITTMAILLPECAYSLGIGDLKLHSKLNQNLKAEIELLTSANEEISDLYVGLASPEKFDEAGIPWSYFLKNIKFKPVKKPNGAIVIELTSNESLKELFLSFVLEVSWNKHNFLNREFTVLVDPSTTYASRRYKKKSVAENKSPFLGSSVNETTHGKDRTQYGRIKRTDFIWKIAKKIRYPDVSIEQMIMALFKANPDAFYADNINALTVKEMLDIPKKELALEMPRKEALAAVKQQNLEWKQRDVTDKASESETTTDISKVSSQIASETFDLNLTKKAASFSDKGASFTPAEKPREKPPTVISSAEGLALLARLDKLEQKLDMLLSKDKQSTATPPTSNNTATVDDSAKAKPKPLVSSSEGLALLTRQNELEQKLEMMQKMRVSNTEPITAQQEPKQPATALQANRAPPSVESVKPAATTALSPVKQEPETNAMLLAIYGMGGGLFLGTLGCFWWLKRKNQQKTELERTSKYANPALPITLLDQVIANPIDQVSSTTIDQVISKDSGFLSNYADVFDSDRIDPVIETDMYLAHGLYEKAETLMCQTIRYHPEKSEYHLKLLEIFLASNNKAAFDAYLAKLTSAGKYSDSEFLNAIAKMEAQLHSQTPFDLSRLDDVAHSTSNAGAKTANDNDLDVALADDAKTVATHETAFDSSGFDAEPIANTDLETADNNQSEAEWFDDEQVTNNDIAFDLSDFDTEPVANAGIEFTDNTQSDIEAFDKTQATSHEVAFDVFDFNTESVANPELDIVGDEQENIALADDESVVV